MLTLPWGSEAWWNYCHDAYLKREWVYRRIDTITLLDDERTQLNTSLQVDSDELRRVTSLPLFANSDRIPLPLEQRKRHTHLLSMKVSINGQSQIIWNNEDNTRLAFSVLLYHMNKEERSTEGDTLANHSDIMNRLRDDLYPSIRDGNVQQRVEELNRQVRKVLEEPEYNRSLPLDVIKYYWALKRLIFDNKSAYSYLMTLKMFYPITVWMNLPIQSKDLSIEIETIADTKPENRFRIKSHKQDRVGSFYYQIYGSQFNSLNDDGYHLKLVCPEGMLISSIQAIRNSSGADDEGESIPSDAHDEGKKGGSDVGDGQESGDTDGSMVTDYRELGVFGNSSFLEFFGSVYKKSFDEKHKPDLLLRLVPRNRLFLYRVTVVCIALIVFLSFSLISLGKDKLDDTTVLFSIVALLPSTLLLFYQKDDHELLNRALKRSRIHITSILCIFILLVYSAFVMRSILAYLKLPFSLRKTIIQVLSYLIFSFICFLVFYLIYVLRKCRVATRLVGRHLEAIRESWDYPTENDPTK